MAQLVNICREICSGSKKIPLRRIFNISAGEKAPFPECKLGDQRAVILKTDTILVIGIKAREAPGIMIPENFCSDTAYGKAFPSPQSRYSNMLFSGGGIDLIVAGDIFSAALIELAPV